ncbi:MAG: alpha/beta fold hydrolase [Gemmataceae bacterium]|nr:alpha/beta fold hydrolase [Gemmataceae bacterium]
MRALRLAAVLAFTLALTLTLTGLAPVLADDPDLTTPRAKKQIEDQKALIARSMHPTAVLDKIAFDGRKPLLGGDFALDYTFHFTSVFGNEFRSKMRFHFFGNGSFDRCEAGESTSLVSPFKVSTVAVRLLKDAFAEKLDLKNNPELERFLGKSDARQLLDMWLKFDAAPFALPGGRPVFNLPNIGTRPQGDEVQTLFHQMHPPQKDRSVWTRSASLKRAVVLIHGLSFSLDDAQVALAGFQDFQLPGSPLIRSLAPHADVYSFGYGQNASVDRIATLPALKEGIERLRKLGYTEVVLIGHSAGGIIARQFVEDNPDVGVTKIVQVCTPNGGSHLAAVPVAAASQRAFLDSLTERGRKKTLKDRAGKQIPKDVQCVCIIGNGVGGGDIVVSSRCQWPEDLQEQGVRCIALPTLHFVVMCCRDSAACMADVVLRDQPRWSPDEVEKMRKQIRPGGIQPPR